MTASMWGCRTIIYHPALAAASAVGLIRGVLFVPELAARHETWGFYVLGDDRMWVPVGCKHSRDTLTDLYHNLDIRVKKLCFCDVMVIYLTLG